MPSFPHLPTTSEHDVTKNFESLLPHLEALEEHTRVLETLKPVVGAWTALTLEATVAQLAGTVYVPGFRLEGTGAIRLKGTLQNVSGAEIKEATTFATISVAGRPGQNIRPVASQLVKAAAKVVPISLLITTAGAIQASANLAKEDEIFLDGVTFTLS